MLDKIERLSLANEKNEFEIALKLTEETGEVAQALLSAKNTSGSVYKTETIEDVKEESIDVTLVALSLFFKVGGTIEELEETLNTKLNKWERVSDIK